MTYSNTHGRFSVKDNLCDLSFAATDATGAVTATKPAALPNIFGVGNGVPPTGGINMVLNTSVGGARNLFAATSPSTGMLDFAFDSARCQRDLVTGTSANAVRVKSGIAEVQRTANLRGKPVIVVHGRSDTLVPVNFSSRPYFAQNQIVEGANSKMRYIEVTNAQHFDAFLTFPGYDTRYIPLHVYFNRAMDALWNNLRSGTALPPSQVVRTTPRGGTPGAAPAITAANVPAINAAPPAGDRITFGGGTLTIPE
jgi:hydroxybutyrate-dimer hydrolase